MAEDRNLPEGVIDADPPGGWESGDAADAETAAQDAAAAGSPRLSESGIAPEGDAVSPDAPVESDEPSQGTDPDLVAGGEDE